MEIYQLPGRGEEAAKYGPSPAASCAQCVIRDKRLSECQEQLRETEAVATKQQGDIQKLLDQRYRDIDKIEELTEKVSVLEQEILSLNATVTRTLGLSSDQ